MRPDSSRARSPRREIEQAEALVRAIDEALFADGAAWVVEASPAA